MKGKKGELGEEPSNAIFQEHFDLSQADAGITGYIMSETLSSWKGDTVKFSIYFYTSLLAGKALEKQQLGYKYNS